MSPTLKAILGIVFVVVGIVMVILDEDSPIGGEGLVLQFLPNRLVGLVSLMVGVVFAASLLSESAGSVSDELVRLNEKQQHLADSLGAVAAIPFTLFLAGLGIGHLWGAFTDGDIGAAVGWAVWVALCGFVCLESTAYLGLTEDPVTMLRNL